MLVLSRKVNESIVINDDITITIVEIRGDKVRLGIEAPAEMSVHRREVLDAIRGFTSQRPAASSPIPVRPPTPLLRHPPDGWAEEDPFFG